MNHCDECGFTYDAIAIADIPLAIRSLGPQYAERLTNSAASDTATAVRARPQPDVWSALEYACHVRDVLMVQRERVQLTLVEERPEYVPMGRDERAVRDRYNEQDPAAVAVQLRTAADALAAELAALDAQQWRRTGIYNFPEPAVRDVAWIGRHTIHEGEHHLRDLDASLGAELSD